MVRAPAHLHFTTIQRYPATIDVRETFYARATSTYAFQKNIKIIYGLKTAHPKNIKPIPEQKNPFCHYAKIIIVFAHDSYAEGLYFFTIERIGRGKFKNFPIDRLDC